MGGVDSNLICSLYLRSFSEVRRALFVYWLVWHTKTVRTSYPCRRCIKYSISYWRADLIRNYYHCRIFLQSATNETRSHLEEETIRDGGSPSYVLCNSLDLSQCLWIWRCVYLLSTLRGDDFESLKTHSMSVSRDFPTSNNKITEIPVKFAV